MSPRRLHVLPCLLLALSVWAALPVLPAHAEEGMWPLHDFPAAAVEDAYGVEIDDAWLDHVQRSTVRVGGGCTGSFVSPDGLVLTNNHCIWGCVRNLSSSERNLSDTGFLAADRGEEIQCPRLQVSVLEDTREITDSVREVTAGKGEVEARQARDSLVARLEEACEEDGTYACQAVDLYRGGEVHLYKYRRWDDIRLVFSPELAIAAFGGDPDNFQFPRWSYDVSFLRVYGDDGEPVASPDFLLWDVDGPEVGQPVFSAGHPASTQRQLTVAELEETRRQTPRFLLLSSELRGRLEQWGETSDEAARLVRQRILSLENSLKIARHRLDSLLDGDQMGAKRRREEELRRAVAADPELAAAYGSAWDDAERAVAARRALADGHYFIERENGFEGILFGYGIALVRGAHEAEKPNDQRMRHFQDQSLPGFERWLTSAVPVDTELEIVRLSFSLAKLREWLGPDHPVVRSVLGQASPDSRAEELVHGTRLVDPEVRRALWEGGLEAIQASDDPILAVVRAIEPAAREIRRRYEDEVEAPLRQATERIAQARFAVLGGSVYPDATSSLRVTYGSVRGWTENGEAIPPFTHLSRLWERATGEDPFRLPESWLAARDELDPSIPYNFVANTDVTGGSSGSPMVDADGRLVGLVFDGNIHSIAGSYWFDGELNRTVAVHPAIILEALETVYGADDLLDELSFDPPAATDGEGVDR